MAYTDILPLDEAKSYLRVDHTDSDAEITRMISTALRYIEEQTGYILEDTAKTYRLEDGLARVYDHPINTLPDALDSTVTVYERDAYSIYEDTDGANEEIELNVGYVDPLDVPDWIKDVALEMIDYWYYKNDGRTSMTMIGDGAKEVINTFKRFII